MNTLKLELPWPPSVNRYWRHNRGRTHISAEGRRYRADVAAIIMAGMHQGLPFEGSVRLVGVMHPPDRRRRDLDNLLKAIFDALEFACVVKDDSQVVDIHIRFAKPEKGGKITLALFPIKEVSDGIQGNGGVE